MDGGVHGASRRAVVRPHETGVVRRRDYYA